VNNHVKRKFKPKKKKTLSLSTAIAFQVFRTLFVTGTFIFRILVTIGIVAFEILSFISHYSPRSKPTNKPVSEGFLYLSQTEVGMLAMLNAFDD
jgi:hypothetical protein